VNSISVGTSSRRFYVEQLYMDVLTTIEAEMKLGAVLNFKSLDYQIGAHEESYGLQHKIQINPLFYYARHKEKLTIFYTTYGPDKKPTRN
jgi:hypothetical protein